MDSSDAQSFLLRFWYEQSQLLPGHWRGTVWHEQDPEQRHIRVDGPEEAFSKVRDALARGTPLDGHSGHSPQPERREFRRFFEAPLSKTWRKLISPREHLMLSPTQATFGARGFASDDPYRRAALEEIGLTFIAGYNAALRASSAVELSRFAEDVPQDLRGFAAEGAAMGFAIADAIPFRAARLPELIQAFDEQFTYLVHVGAGWALARVPWRKRQILQSLDPVHGWLALDGLGFHDCYFHHARVLAGWRREHSGYSARAYDQGVGRAIWFVCGGSAALSAAAIRRLEAKRHPDLFAGLGLAMAYAGPAAPGDLLEAVNLAGPQAASFRQGIAFACEARVRAGYTPAATKAAAQAIGSKPEDLAQLVRVARGAAEDTAEWPRYEVWRQLVSAAIASGLDGLP